MPPARATSSGDHNAALHNALQGAPAYKTPTFWIVVAVVVAVDFASKVWAEGALAPRHVPHHIVGNLLRFTLAYNEGAAFGMHLGPASRWIFSVALDATITPELRAEGLAREVVSRVQRLRKDGGLDVADRITLAVDGDSEMMDAVQRHRGWIADEVLAHEIVVGRGEATEATTGTLRGWTAAQAVDVDGRSLAMALNRDNR
jgi:hypothetical protein